MLGTIIEGTNNVFSVECDDGVVRSCTIKGKKIKTEKQFYNPLAPGDCVQIEEDGLSNDKAQIVRIEPRRNVFLRWNIKSKRPQLLAANIDYLVLVTTPAEPPFRPRFVDRELIQADAQGIVPVIVVNKYDLMNSLNQFDDSEGDGNYCREGLDNEGTDSAVSGMEGVGKIDKIYSTNSTDRAAEFRERISGWEKLGYIVKLVSAKTGEGLMDLAELLQNKRSVFVGQSGVGKSSLINRLDNSIVLRTGSLSKKYGRGAHTTTKGTLVHLTLNEAFTGGLQGVTADIIDTPGIRRFILNEIPAEDVALYFREFKPLLGKCKFGASCTHTTEPGCKILEGVASGEISRDRYESYRRITEEISSGLWRE